MPAASEELMSLIDKGLRLQRRLQLRGVLLALVTGTILALAGGLWFRVLAVVVVLVGLFVVVFIPLAESGFVRGRSLLELARTTPERSVWLSVFQVPNRFPHVHVHDGVLQRWTLRLPPQEALRFIELWRELAPRVHVSMHDPQRAIEWSKNQGAPLEWPPSPPLELTPTGFRDPKT